MKKYLFFLLIAILLAGMQGEVNAESFTVGVENIEYYPHYTYEDGEYGGFGREVLDRFGEEYGYEFEYEAMPVTRLFENFVAEKVDFKYPDNPYWSEDLKEGKEIVYSEEVVSYIDGVSVKMENEDMKVEDLNNLGTVMGFTPYAYQDLIEEGEINLQETSDFEGLLKQVQRGRIDGAYANIAIVEYTLEEMGGEKLLFNPDLPHTESHYYLSTIKHPEVIEDFNQFLTENEDEIKEIKRDYNVLMEDYDIIENDDESDSKDVE
ncbi:MAG: hypothetical protein ACOC4L_00155 [Halanaerobium sp.]